MKGCVFREWSLSRRITRWEKESLLASFFVDKNVDTENPEVCLVEMQALL